MFTSSHDYKAGLRAATAPTLPDDLVDLLADYVTAPGVDLLEAQQSKDGYYTVPIWSITQYVATVKKAKGAPTERRDEQPIDGQERRVIITSIKTQSDRIVRAQLNIWATVEEAWDFICGG